jgi:hypothetical protein
VLTGAYLTGCIKLHPFPCPSPLQLTAPISLHMSPPYTSILLGSDVTVRQRTSLFVKVLSIFYFQPSLIQFCFIFINIVPAIVLVCYHLKLNVVKLIILPILSSSILFLSERKINIKYLCLNYC